VLLGVTGGIAAYKSCLLLRMLAESGCRTRVVTTRHAEHFVGRLTFSTLSGHPAYADPFEEGEVDHTEHIDLSQWADLAIVAPATANIIGKAANGIADDFLSTLLCAFDKPRLFAPAMNLRMWHNPAVQRNLRQLEADGATLAPPDEGWLACGEVGAGRMAAPERIFEWARWLLVRSDELAGRRVLVTAGPTREDLDDVRFLSNPSTGKMGFALARGAQHMGAVVRLVSGPVDLPTPIGVCRTDVRSAAEMRDAVHRHYDETEILVMCAAVADYSPRKQPGKLKKGPGDLELRLGGTEDILAGLAVNKGDRLHVGFAVETSDELENARLKLERKKLDLICVNNPLEEGSGFGCDTNRVTLLDREGGEQRLPLLDKDETARRILARAARMISRD